MKLHEPPREWDDHPCWGLFPHILHISLLRREFILRVCSWAGRMGRLRGKGSTRAWLGQRSTVLLAPSGLDEDVGTKARKGKFGVGNARSWTQVLLSL